MDGRIDGLYLIGRRMRTWQGNGTTLPGNGVGTRMIKVFYPSLYCLYINKDEKCFETSCFCLRVLISSVIFLIKSFQTTYMV